MFPGPLIALGATLGTATALLALCGLAFLFKCIWTEKGPHECDQKTSKKNLEPRLLQPRQQFSIQKSIQHVQPQTLLKCPWIYNTKLTKTAPQIVNDMTSDMKKIAEETMTAHSNNQGSDESSEVDQTLEDIFILSTNGEGDDGCTIEDLNCEKPVTSQAPRLCYSLDYNIQKAELCVSFLEALIRSSEDNQDTECDCYILGCLTTNSGTLEARTRLVRKAFYMTWEETLLFPLAQEQQAEASLSITLWNCDRFSGHTVMGQGKVSVVTAGAPCGIARWVHLEVPEKVQAAVQLAEILLSISYLPSANRLMVVLIKARNLHLCTQGNLLGKDVSVKLTLRHQDLKLKKKQSRQSKKHINPVWNEMIMFELPQELLEASSVELEIFSQEASSRLNCLLGRCHLGLQSEGTESSHWQEMMKNPRKQIAKWHMLCQ